MWSSLWIDPFREKCVQLAAAMRFGERVQKLGCGNSPRESFGVLLEKSIEFFCPHGLLQFNEEQGSASVNDGSIGTVTITRDGQSDGDFFESAHSPSDLRVKS